MSGAAHTRGRGLVISGALLIGLNLTVTIVVAGYILFFDALVARGVGDGFGPALIITGLAVVAPSWFLGVPLLAVGRSQQRGPVKGAVFGWIVALAAVPVALVLLLIMVNAAVTAFYSRTADPVPAWASNSVFALVPLAIISAFAALAWLVWGKPAKPVGGGPAGD